MYYAGFREEGYSQDYIEARKQIDELCDLIVMGVVSRQKAFEEYNRVELGFTENNPEISEFFKMIYRSRIERLTSQFSPEKNNGS